MSSLAARELSRDGLFFPPKPLPRTRFFPNNPTRDGLKMDLGVKENIDSEVSSQNNVSRLSTQYGHLSSHNSNKESEETSTKIGRTSIYPLLDATDFETFHDEDFTSLPLAVHSHEKLKQKAKSRSMVSLTPKNLSLVSENHDVEPPLLSAPSLSLESLLTEPQSTHLNNFEGYDLKPCDPEKSFRNQKRPPPQLVKSESKPEIYTNSRFTHTEPKYPNLNTVKQEAHAKPSMPPNSSVEISRPNSTHSTKTVSSKQKTNKKDITGSEVRAVNTTGRKEHSSNAGDASRIYENTNGVYESNVTSANSSPRKVKGRYKDLPKLKIPKRPKEQNGALSEEKKSQTASSNNGTSPGRNYFNIQTSLANITNKFGIGPLKKYSKYNGENDTHSRNNVRSPTSPGTRTHSSERPSRTPTRKTGTPRAPNSARTKESTRSKSTPRVLQTTHHEQTDLQRNSARVENRRSASNQRNSREIRMALAQRSSHNSDHRSNNSTNAEYSARHTHHLPESNYRRTSRHSHNAPSAPERRETTDVVQGTVTSSFNFNRYTSNRMRIPLNNLTDFRNAYDKVTAHLNRGHELIYDGKYAQASLEFDNGLKLMDCILEVSVDPLQLSVLDTTLCKSIQDVLSSDRKRALEGFSDAQAAILHPRDVPDDIPDGAPPSYTQVLREDIQKSLLGGGDGRLFDDCGRSNVKSVPVPPIRPHSRSLSESKGETKSKKGQSHLEVLNSHRGASFNGSVGSSNVVDLESIEIPTVPPRHQFPQSTLSPSTSPFNEPEPNFSPFKVEAVTSHDCAEWGSETNFSPFKVEAVSRHNWAEWGSEPNFSSKDEHSHNHTSNSSEHNNNIAISSNQNGGIVYGATAVPTLFPSRTFSEILDTTLSSGSTRTSTGESASTFHKSNPQSTSAASLIPKSYENVPQSSSKQTSARHKYETEAKSNANIHINNSNFLEVTVNSAAPQSITLHQPPIPPTANLNVSQIPLPSRNYNFPPDVCPNSSKTDLEHAHDTNLNIPGKSDSGRSSARVNSPLSARPEVGIFPIPKPRTKKMPIDEIQGESVNQKPLPLNLKIREMEEINQELLKNWSSGGHNAQTNKRNNSTRAEEIKEPENIYANIQEIKAEEYLGITESASANSELETGKRKDSFLQSSATVSQNNNLGAYNSNVSDINFGSKERIRDESNDTDISIKSSSTNLGLPSLKNPNPTSSSLTQNPQVDYNKNNNLDTNVSISAKKFPDISVESKFKTNEFCLPIDGMSNTFSPPVNNEMKEVRPPFATRISVLNEFDPLKDAEISDTPKAVSEDETSKDAQTAYVTEKILQIELLEQESQTSKMSEKSDIGTPAIDEGNLSETSESSSYESSVQSKRETLLASVSNTSVQLKSSRVSLQSVNSETSKKDTEQNCKRTESDTRDETSDQGSSSSSFESSSIFEQGFKRGLRSLSSLKLSSKKSKENEDRDPEGVAVGQSEFYFRGSETPLWRVILTIEEIKFFLINKEVEVVSSPVDRPTLVVLEEVVERPAIPIVKISVERKLGGELWARHLSPISSLTLKTITGTFIFSKKNGENAGMKFSLKTKFSKIAKFTTILSSKGCFQKELARDHELKKEPSKTKQVLNKVDGLVGEKGDSLRFTAMDVTRQSLRTIKFAKNAFSNFKEQPQNKQFVEPSAQEMDGELGELQNASKLLEKMIHLNKIKYF